MFSLGRSGHHARSDRGLTGAILPFRVLIAPFVLQPVAWPPAPAYVVTVHKGSGMSVFRPSRLGGSRRRNDSQGFTLIELMVTVAVLAIIAAIAVPSMEWLINASRLSGHAEELSSALQLARSEALRTAAPVTICGSNDGTNCVNSDQWSRLIVLGRNNLASDQDGTERFNVYRDVTLPAGIQLRGPAAGVTFNPTGLSRAQGTLTVCIRTTRPAQNQRVITVMISGATRTGRNNGAGEC
ncbi:MAG: GspH/FimT family pseudopilin [Pseudoxanthomonas mexicana]|nr:GspH/FimT family pseudopilin [Pseudoxanthomonas mexicana]